LLTATERAVVVSRFGAGARVKDVVAEFGLAHTSACRIKDEAALSRRRAAHSPHRLSGDRESVGSGTVDGVPGDRGWWRAPAVSSDRV
jgi:hypothetical protein